MRPPSVLIAMQRENELSRATVRDTRTDDRSRCTPLLVREVGGTFAFYQHGAAKWGVRLTDEETHALARQMQDAP